LSAVAIRLLVLDLDGTVLQPDLGVSPRVVAAVAAVQERGIPVTIATGRMYRSASRHAATLGIRLPIVCYQGAYIRDLPGPNGEPGVLHFHRHLSAAVTRDAIIWAREHGLDPHVNAGDRLIVQRSEKSEADYEEWAGIGAEFVDDLLAGVPELPTKVLAVGHDDLPQRLLGIAREAFARRAEVTVSHPDYLEWTGPGVHKALGVRWLARSLGIPMRHTMAIGDQYNDLELLAAVGHGVAMGQAPAPVREVARYVTAPLSEDGAALAIEALVLGQGSLD
jgi:Cof subfamily protein (haloacid dehalogenase superfamily)